MSNIHPIFRPILNAIAPRPLDQGDIDIALQEAQVLEDDGRPTAAECIRACARAAQATLRNT
jgi:hypothetical protein